MYIRICAQLELLFVFLLCPQARSTTANGAYDAAKLDWISASHIPLPQFNIKTKGKKIQAKKFSSAFFQHWT